MHRRWIFPFAIAAVTSHAAPLHEKKPKVLVTVVGGGKMSAAADIVANSLHSKDHTTFVAALKAAGLVALLKGKGPFTVFAATNEAFAALPHGDLEWLFRRENKKKLIKLMRNHIVAGKIRIAEDLHHPHDPRMVKTLDGATLTLKADGKRMSVTDSRGAVGHIIVPDVPQANGLIQVVDILFRPKP